MNSISNHISDLLFDHECVVIPGFGALISRYYPAEINPATHMMRPPSRRVAFNSRISDNDGLLGNYLGKMSGCSYKDAMNQIEALVADWNNQLKEGRKVNLPGVGRFYLDGNQKIQFNPSIDINYHKASFGLSIFRGHALQREIEINKGIQKAIEKQVPAVRIIAKAEKRNKRLYIRWAAVATPLIALGLAAGIYVQSSSIYDYAGFFHFGKTDSDKIELKAEPGKTVAKEEKEIPVIEASVTASPLIEEVKNEPAITDIPDNISDDTYHIVVGSFKEKVNASNYVQDLKSRGFDAYIAEGDTNFRRVAIGRFSNREDAANLLATVKKDINPSAWVFSN